MKAIHVGILTPHRRYFYEFEQDNPVFVCHHIEHEYDLQSATFDYFIRLDDWKRMNPTLLRTVKTIEKLRDIDKAPLSPKMGWGYSGHDKISTFHGMPHSKTSFDELMKIPDHPMNRCDMRMTVGKVAMDEAVKKAGEAFKKISESWVGASISVKDAAKALTILPDESSETT